MRVFVAGATGAIGRRIVPALVAAGHEVTGTTRSEARAAAVREAGARALVCDALDGEAVRRAVLDAGPEVVVNQLTALPAAYGDLRKGTAPTNRLRTEGARHLTSAAREAGARRLVSQSVAFFYAPRGPQVLDEDAPLWTDAPDPVATSVDAVVQLERMTLEEGGVVLRYGALYGPGTWNAASDGDIAAQVRARRFPVVGSGAGLLSHLHVADAASATVVAVEGDVTGVFNVTDDAPVPVAEWLPEFARELGAKPPRHVPAWLARLVAGPAAVATLTQQRGASNARWTATTGWRPSYPRWQDGFAADAG